MQREVIFVGTISLNKVKSCNLQDCSYINLLPYSYHVHCRLKNKKLLYHFKTHGLSNLFHTSFKFLCYFLFMLQSTILQVRDVRLIMDRISRRSKGVGYAPYMFLVIKALVIHLMYPTLYLASIS